MNTPEHPGHPTVDLKLETIHRCFELGKDVKSVSEEIGYSRASIYAWRRTYVRKDTIALMGAKDIPRDKLTEGSSSDTKEPELLKAERQDMRLKIDILKTINVLKRPPHQHRNPQEQGKDSDCWCLERQISTAVAKEPHPA